MKDGMPPDAARESVRTADGLALALYRWLPRRDAAPRATIALVHGLAEHAGRYAGLAERLGAADLELVAVDLRGHGRSPGERVWVERFDEYLLDLEALLDAARRPGVPLFLMGHSLGGAVAALFAVERLAGFAAKNGPVAGLVLSGAALAPGRDVPRPLIAASRFVSRIWPHFPAIRLDAGLLARDTAVANAYRRDPLVHHGSIPARTGAELLAAMARIKRGRAALTLPVLVFHGGDDKLTEPDGSRDFAAHAGASDCTLAIYEGSRHETMNDLDRDRVIAALIGWIVARA